MTFDIADFYQQLALLIKSNLPLPDSLRQLGRYFPRRDFQDAILKVSELTARGDKFSDVIKRYPQFFPPFHVQLISAGETSGTLPEILFAVARLARFGQLLTAKVRDILAYPLLTIHLCLMVFFFLSIYIVPSFSEIFDDILGGATLPALTAYVINTGNFVATYSKQIFTLYIIFLVFTIWLFTPWIIAHRTMLALINHLPGSCRIGHSLDCARLCGMWSTFLQQNMTAPDALMATAQLVEGKALRAALLRTAKNVRSGSNLVEMLSREKSVDALIVLTFKYSSEDDLSQELKKLGELFEHRVTLAARSATITWTIIALLLMTLFVAFVVLSLFLPLISIMNMMSC